MIAAKYHPEMPKRVREILEKVGDQSIMKIQLGRTPVQALLIGFLNLLSGGNFASKKIELGYDEIYHNYLLITIQKSQGLSTLQQMTTNGNDQVPQQVFKLEKAHRVRLMDPAYPDDFVDVYDIPLTAEKSFTLNRLITVASNVDKHFFSYDAANNNMCQTFVENIVDINGLTGNIVDEVTRRALKPQDAKTLVATLGSRSDIVRRVTNLGGTLDKLIYDRQIVWKKPLQKEFNVVGNMHVKTIDHENHNLTKEVQPTGFKSFVVDGTSETILENTDEIYQAAVALENVDSKKQAMRTWIILGMALLVLAGAAFLFWRKRNLCYKDRNKKEINRTVSHASSSQRTSTSSIAASHHAPLL